MDSGIVAAPMEFWSSAEYNARLCERMSNTIVIQKQPGDSLYGVFWQCAIAARARPIFL